MKLHFYLLILLLTCSTFGIAQTGSFNYGGQNRNYRYHLPPSYNPSNSYPLVLNLHGAGSNAWQQELYSDMNPVADTGNFIVIYPDGINMTWNVGWNGAYFGAPYDEGFLSTLIDTMAANFNIDLKRVYACGMSNGGFMSYRLACHLSQRIAAVATATGLMNDSIATYCNAPRQVPILQMHGTLDPIVAYNGAPGISWSANASINYWVSKQNCNPTPVVTNLPNTALEGSSITSYQYTSCDGQSEVLFYDVINGGHTWPGGGFPIPLVGIMNQDIHGSSEMWRFFLRHQLDTIITDTPTELLASQVSLFPNPARGKLTINTNLLIEFVNVYDLRGKLIFEKNVQEEIFSLDLEKWQNGIYLIELIGADFRKFEKIILQH